MLVNISITEYNIEDPMDTIRHGLFVTMNKRSVRQYSNNHIYINDEDIKKRAFG